MTRLFKVLERRKQCPATPLRSMLSWAMAGGGGRGGGAGSLDPWFTAFSFVTLGSYLTLPVCYFAPCLLQTRKQAGEVLAESSL